MCNELMCNVTAAVLNSPAGELVISSAPGLKAATNFALSFANIPLLFTA